MPIKNDYTHLSDESFDMLFKSKQERINYTLQPQWIGYPRAMEILNRLEFLIHHPKIERMPNLLILGNTNSGKTQIIRRFEQTYPSHIDEDTGKVIQEVVFVSSPSTPDERQFVIRFLDYMKIPYTQNSNLAIKKEQVKKGLIERQTRMIIIDEFQHLIAGSHNAQRSFLNYIKDLSNELKIPIVAAGVESAFSALQTDEQLANRFDIAVIPKWRVDSREDAKKFASLINSIEKQIPLDKPSNLFKGELLKEIYYRSEGLIGEASKAIRLVALKAIESDVDCITKDYFMENVDLPPSKRTEVLKWL